MALRSLTMTLFAFTALASGASAQQSLNVQIVDNIGGASLIEDAYGCFDPLAAIQLHQDGDRGQASSETRRAFEVGSCVVLEEGTEMTDAQMLSIDGEEFVRGKVSSGALMVYAPAWSVAINNNDEYDPSTAQTLASMDDVADDLAARVAEMQACLEEGQEISDQIAALNAQVDEVEHKGVADGAGSRLTGSGGSYSSEALRYPDRKQERLYFEAKRLKEDQDDFWERCGEYKDGIDLDQDYLTFAT